MVDDAQSERRDPSHSDLEFEIRRCGLAEGDPRASGQTVGKAKRIRAVLSWAMEHEVECGQDFIASLISIIRGHGGFRDTSTNFIGHEVIENAKAAFSAEGYELSANGELRVQLLDNLSGTALTEALEAYVRRAKRGSDDAAFGDRYKQGTGHGRPWNATVTDAEARLAIETMGIIAERLLNLHLGIK